MTRARAGGLRWATLRMSFLVLAPACTRASPAVTDAGVGGSSSDVTGRATRTETVAAWRPSREPLRGTVGSSPVVVRLAPSTRDPAGLEGTCSGRYFHEQSGVAIELAGGQAANGDVTLDERVGAEVTGHWQLHGDGDTVTGTWSSPDRVRTLAIALRPLARPATTNRAIVMRRHARRITEAQCEVDVEYPELLGLADASVEDALNRALLERADVDKPVARLPGCTLGGGKSDHSRFEVFVDEAGLFSYCPSIDVEIDRTRDAATDPSGVSDCATYDLHTGTLLELDAWRRPGAKPAWRTQVLATLTGRLTDEEATVFEDMVSFAFVEPCGVALVMGEAGATHAGLFQGGHDDRPYEIPWARVRGLLLPASPVAAYARGRPACHDPRTLGPVNAGTDGR